MKTNVTMESKVSRELYGITIRQETENCFLSLTDLQEAYTHARVLNGWSKKDVSHILNYEDNTERIYYLLKEQEIVNDKTLFTEFYKNVKEKGMTKVLKELGVYKTTGRGENKQTICNPYIWVLVAMELNPQLYAKVVLWLTDKLIANRIEACELNKDLRSAMAQYIPNPDYPLMNKTLNIKAFGYHEAGMRNRESTEKLHKLNMLEETMAYCIKKGFYKTNSEVIEAIKNA